MPPASKWTPSRRRFPNRLPELEYPDHYLKRLISESGTFAFRCHYTYLSSALAGEWVGMEEIENGIWAIHFCDQELSRYDEWRKKSSR